MTSRDFCYWLQGFFEIDDALPEAKRQGLGQPQVDMIKKHLALVFKHEIDPSFGDPEHQAELDAIHSPQEPGKPEGRYSPPVHPIIKC